jgi:hypothetical protein
MIITDWIQTYVFLGYPPSSDLDVEIFNKAKEVGTGWRRGNPINPNELSLFKQKYSSYSQSFLQQYFQDRVGNP